MWQSVSHLHLSSRKAYLAFAQAILKIIVCVLSRTLEDIKCQSLDKYFYSSFAGFDVAKTGDARIGFVGFPSVGKSTLLSNLAGVYSEVAAYEFTTLTTVPGVIRYKGAKIQVRSGVCEGRMGCTDTVLLGFSGLA